MKITIPIKYMAKNLGKILATTAVAGLALFAPMKAKGTIAPQITTTIYDDIDQDATRDGFQIRYEWNVNNVSPPSSDWTQDAVWQYSISANLEERGMYNLQNNDDSQGWDFFSGEQSYFKVNANGGALPPGFPTTFSALVDQNLAIGTEQVSSTAIANSNNYSSNVTVPIPEPMAMGLFALGGAAALVGRKAKEYYRQV